VIWRPGCGSMLKVRQTMPDRPDEVYLVSTAVETPWWS
jgi:hypothetical protein